MEPIVYREMGSGEEAAVCELIARVFKEMVAPDYESEGIEEFFRFANPIGSQWRSVSVLVASCWSLGNRET